VTFKLLYPPPCGVVIGAFKKTLFQKGISPNQHLIVFDEKQNANAASRLWWMFKAIGHEKVQVLNGGFQKEIKSFF
jgi:thiosulfate/3-mercaptopyruvate sulfurtransferase